MIRTLSFLLADVWLVYLGVIYKSSSLLFVAFLLLYSIFFLFLYNLYVIFHIQVQIRFPIQFVQVGKEIPLEIILRNNGILPSGKLVIRVSGRSVDSKWGRSAVFFSAVPGTWRRKGGEAQSVTVLGRMKTRGQTPGKIIFRIKNVWSYDLFGILRLSARGGKNRQLHEIVVLPEIYEAPLILGQNAKNPSWGHEIYGQAAQRTEPAEKNEIREYRPGDKIRSIHWKLSAKSDELMVRDIDQEQEASVLFFLEWKKNGEKYRKKRQQREWFYTVVLSVSYSLARQGCRHYVVWYDRRQKDLVRFLVSGEEDIYEMLSQVCGIAETGDGFEIKNAYREKYVVFPGNAFLILRENLCLEEAEGKQIQYQGRDLKNSLESNVISI